MTKKVHALKPGTERRGDYREALCGAYNRGTMRLTAVIGIATCKKCAAIEAKRS